MGRKGTSKKTLKRCKNKGEADNVVLIDVDSDNFSNVIVIDVPESLQKKLRDSSSSAPRRDKKSSSRTIIYIDDDEGTENNHPGIGVDGDENFCGASSSRRSSSTSNHSENAADAVGDECQFVQENISPVKLSKCKRTYSGKNASTRSHCGLSKESESRSSDNDGPDCEFMEDSFGKLREQWEKASLKRKDDFRNGQPGARDQASASKNCNDTHQDVGAEKKTEQHTEALASSKASFEKEDSFGREQWEKASFRNKKDVHNGQPGPRDQAGASCTDSRQDVGTEGRTEGHTEASVSPSSSKTSNENQGKACSVDEKEVSFESISNGQQEDAMDNQLHAQDGDAKPALQSSLINEREKLKETDEYKRAIEEEWASRQRELQIQAEEAQHLRRLQKRRRAESMRLLEMEKRQKQRVEEMRETQKKDEENLNLKELHRAEVRKELNKLEISCHDMASLLRGLGIHVNGGIPPLTDEVRAAYKRALLSFHPDRATQSDIRLQVEAEEKFKLISRMKDKFKF